MQSVICDANNCISIRFARNVLVFDESPNEKESFGSKTGFWTLRCFTAYEQWQLHKAERCLSETGILFAVLLGKLWLLKSISLNLVWPKFRQTKWVYCLSSMLRPKSVSSRCYLMPFLLGFLEKIIFSHCLMFRSEQTSISNLIYLKQENNRNNLVRPSGTVH